MDIHKPRLWFLVGIIALLLLFLFTAPTLAQDEADCLSCHEDESTHIKGSVHSFLDCTSCHTNIEKYPHPKDALLNKKESSAVCADCHKGRIANSYKESFHGKAVHLGSEKSASCTDCHGAHDILPKENPNSQVSKENTPKTCASCHGQAAPGFAEGTDHFELAAVGPGAPMYKTAQFFIWLTIITIVALVAHIELQLFHHLRTILKKRKGGNKK